MCWCWTGPHYVAMDRVHGPLTQTLGMAPTCLSSECLGHCHPYLLEGVGAWGTLGAEASLPSPGAIEVTCQLRKARNWLVNRARKGRLPRPCPDMGPRSCTQLGLCRPEAGLMSLRLPVASWGPLGHPPSPRNVHLGESLSHRKVPLEGTPAPPPAILMGRGPTVPPGGRQDWVSSSRRSAGSGGGEGLLGGLANDYLSELLMKGLPHLLCHYLQTPGCLSPGPARQEVTPQLYKMLGHPTLISPTAPQPGPRVQEHIRSLGVHGGSALSPRP